MAQIVPRLPCFLNGSFQAFVALLLHGKQLVLLLQSHIPVDADRHQKEDCVEEKHQKQKCDADHKIPLLIAPGVERVDTIKTDSGYEMKSIWCRNDLSDTSIMKLSTATGYIYGYVQDLESGMWQYIILDFATGETVFTMDVSNKYGYNNMAIGMYAGNSGNALYCPTGYLELLCLQDRFVYLPEMPYRKVDLDKAARNVLTQEQFEQAGGEGTVASWRNTVTVENVHPNTTVAFRMNNLSGSAADLELYAYGADGKLAEVSKELWTITDEAGTAVDTLAVGTLYELRVSVADGGAFDLSETEKEIKISVVLAK